jgi:hypothetical protein
MEIYPVDFLSDQIQFNIYIGILSEPSNPINARTKIQGKY